MLDSKAQSVIDTLAASFADIDFAPDTLIRRGDEPGDQEYVRVPADRLLDVMRFLRDDEQCKFEQLCDLTCVDYLNFSKAHDRYGVIYSLLSISLNHRLWVKCFVNDPAPEVPSVTAIWTGANWMEREVYDMFGIIFTGHPDLRRILTWDAFEAHPLRKDYPLRGRGEREDYDTVVRGSA